MPLDHPDDLGDAIAALEAQADQYGAHLRSIAHAGALYFRTLVDDGLPAEHAWTLTQEWHTGFWRVAHEHGIELAREAPWSPDSLTSSE